MRRLALATLVCVLIAGCAGVDGGGAGETARYRSCDDGGSGGVVIDGICL